MRTRRILRALGLALWRTLRGQSPLQDDVERWRLQACAQLAALDSLVAREAIEPQQLRLRIDRREVSMQLILAALRFHLHDEFPQLRRRFGDECLTVLRATCLNDSFQLQRLADAPQLPPALRGPLLDLAQHLLRLPGAPSGPAQADPR